MGQGSSLPSSDWVMGHVKYCMVGCYHQGCRINKSVTSEGKRCPKLCHWCFEFINANGTFKFDHGRPTQDETEKHAGLEKPRKSKRGRESQEEKEYGQSQFEERGDGIEAISGQDKSGKPDYDMDEKHSLSNKTKDGALRLPIGTTYGHRLQIWDHSTVQSSSISPRISRDAPSQNPGRSHGEEALYYTIGLIVLMSLVTLGWFLCWKLVTVLQTRIALRQAKKRAERQHRLSETPAQV